MLIASARSQRMNKLLAIFCGVSFIVHVALVVVWAVGSFQRPPPINLDENVIKTRLVKLGKQRDEKLLPRLDASRPPPRPTNQKGPPTPEPPKQDKAPDKAPDKPEAPPEPKRSAADILKDFADDDTKQPSLDDLIKDRIGEPLDEGHEEGSKFGTDITGRLKADYNDVVKAKVERAYVLPTTLSDEERVRLWTNLFVKIGERGELLDARLSPSSGNDAFDDAVLAAARRATPFPPPPLQLRDFYRQGVGMKVCPITCS